MVIAADEKPFNPDELPRPKIEEIYSSLNTMDITTLNDRFTRTIYQPNTEIRIDDRVIQSSTGWHDSYYKSWDATTLSPDVLDIYDWENITDRIRKEVVGNVRVKNKDSDEYGEHICFCDDKEDLTTDRILKTLSAVKGKLMLDVAPIHIRKIECSMTPAVRRNIIQAGKKLKMYGKKQPILARFDEYGNRLPDEIELDSTEGILLKIVNPEDYGSYYLEMKAIEFAKVDYKAYRWEDDLPF